MGYKSYAKHHYPYEMFHFAENIVVFQKLFVETA